MRQLRSGMARGGLALLLGLLGVLLAVRGPVGQAQPAPAAAPGERLKAPTAPADPVAAKAFAVLEKHCARCHQAGTLSRQAPAAGLANILRLDEIATDARVVEPGNPDASRLVNVILMHEMPFDIRHEGASGEGPSGEDVQALRAWIERLPRGPRCADRVPLETGRLSEEILAHVRQGPAEAVKGWRFVSLAHLYNACASSADLASYRMALTKLVNSLSWRREPVRLVPVDAAETVLRVSLSDLGWVAAHWEMISATYPYGYLADTATTRQIAEAIGTALPFVRGDWLALAAGKAPLYYDLLGAPTQGRELHKVLGIDVEKQIDQKVPRRGGVLGSTVTRADRLLERHALTRGMMWRTYDFLSAGSGSALIDRPVPAPHPRGFRHELAMTMFTLPNGLPAFYLNQSTDRRLDAVPQPMLRQRGPREGALAAGAPCMACHTSGPRAFRDDLRANVVGEARFDREMQDLVAAFHPPGDVLARLVEEDAKGVRAALSAIGVDPDASINGLEPINGLARQHSSRIDLARLAAELGLSAGGLLERSEGAPPPMKRLIARLEQGSVARGQIDEHFAAIASLVGLRPIASAGAPPPGRNDAEAGELSVTLLSDRSQYRAGELVQLLVTVSHDCHLTVINVDKRGRATVLFPNEFEQKALVPAGRELKIPGDRAPYQLRAREAGRESIIALCNRSGTWADGIVHDWERQRFTVLGDYAAFMARAEGSARGEARGGPVRRRGPSPASEGDPRPAAKDLARTGIVLEIR